jgi:hypothetical protein
MCAIDLSRTASNWMARDTDCSEGTIAVLPMFVAAAG